MLLKLEKKVGSSGDSLTILELQALSCLSVLHSEISVKRVLKLLSDPHLVSVPSTRVIRLSYALIQTIPLFVLSVLTVLSS